jgi:hypothetical protein
MLTFYAGILNKSLFPFISSPGIFLTREINMLYNLFFIFYFSIVFIYFIIIYFRGHNNSLGSNKNSLTISSLIPSSIFYGNPALSIRYHCLIKSYFLNCLIISLASTPLDLLVAILQHSHGFDTKTCTGFILPSLLFILFFTLFLFLFIVFFFFFDIQIC